MRLVLMLAIVGFNASAYAKRHFALEDVDASITQSRTHKGYEDIEIVVKNCTSHFEMKYDDLQRALDAKIAGQDSPERRAFEAMVPKAFDRYYDGCK